MSSPVFPYPDSPVELTDKWLPAGTPSPGREGSNSAQSCIFDDLFSVPVPVMLKSREAKSVSPVGFRSLPSPTASLIQDCSFIEQSDLFCDGQEDQSLQCSEQLTQKYLQDLELERKSQERLVTELREKVQVSHEETQDLLRNIQKLQSEVQSLQGKSDKLKSENRQLKKEKSKEKQRKQNSEASLPAVELSDMMKAVYRKLGSPSQKVTTLQGFEQYLEDVLIKHTIQHQGEVNTVETVPVELASNAILATKDKKMVSCVMSFPAFDLLTNTSKVVDARVTCSHLGEISPELQAEKLEKQTTEYRKYKKEEAKRTKSLVDKNKRLQESVECLRRQLRTAESKAQQAKVELDEVMALKGELKARAAQVVKAAEILKAAKTAETIQVSQTALQDGAQSPGRLPQDKQQRIKILRMRKVREDVEQSLPPIAKRAKHRRCSGRKRNIHDGE